MDFWGSPESQPRLTGQLQVLTDPTSQETHTQNKTLASEEQLKLVFGFYTHTACAQHKHTYIYAQYIMGGEIAQWVKHSPCKHKDPSSNPLNLCQSEPGLL